ncbi:MAG: conjugal transfer pilus assembly protein TraU [Pseudomonadota bacterium]
MTLNNRRPNWLVGCKSGWRILPNVMAKVALQISTVAKSLMYIRLAWFTLLILLAAPLKAGNCHGRMLNPITDICWKCIFPIRIAGVKVMSGGPDPKSPRSPICVCKRPGIPVPVPGIPVSFWEPARLVDVTRTPFCLVNMGGTQLANTGIKGRGQVAPHPNTRHKRSFYHVHWYVYPILYWLEVLLDFACLENNAIDLAYLTEVDPFWNDDEKSAIINPEALLFGSHIAQMACIADCAAASAKLPLDILFWCGGCQGSVYPFTGTIADHSGGVQASLLATTRMIAKLHREGLLWGYYGKLGLCGKYPMPIIRKSQYRTQMTYPIPQTNRCQALGATEVLWQGGREFPYKGEDFGYLVWRKRDCCLL